MNRSPIINTDYSAALLLHKRWDWRQVFIIYWSVYSFSQNMISFFRDVPQSYTKKPLWDIQLDHKKLRKKQEKKKEQNVSMKMDTHSKTARRLPRPIRLADHPISWLYPKRYHLDIFFFNFFFYIYLIVPRKGGRHGNWDTLKRYKNNSIFKRKSSFKDDGFWSHTEKNRPFVQ